MIPVLHAEDGILIDEQKRGYAIFVVDGEDYGFQSPSEKLRQIQSVIRGCREVIGEWHLYSLALGISPNRWMAKLPRFSNEIWEAHIKETEKLLKSEQPFERKIYLVVPLIKKEKIEFNITNTKQFAKEMARGAKQALKQFVPFEELTLDRLASWHREKRRWKDRFGSFVRLHQATLSEMEAWLRHGMYRGLVEPDTRIPSNLPNYVSSPNGVVHPIHPLAVWIQDAVFDEEPPFHLVAVHPDGKASYQTFFMALTVPTDIDESYPFGNEWIYEVESLQYPVDVALHVRVEDPKEAQRKLRHKKLIAEAKWKEYTDNNEEAPPELEEEMIASTELGRNLRARVPLVHIKAVYGFGCSTEEELHKRAKDIMSDLRHIQLVQAPGDQQKMWQAFYPMGAELSTSYETPMDPGVFSAGVPFATTVFGDPSGFYLGETFSGRAVFMDPRRPAQELNQPPSILIAGSLGSGKTHLAKDIMTNMLSWGAKIFINDPKGHDYDALAQVPFRTRFIRMEPGREPFNPFRLGLDGAVRDLLDILFNDATETNIRNYREIIISEAVHQTLHSNKKDMFTFGRSLETMFHQESRRKVKEEIDIVISLLNALYKDPTGELLFAEDRGEQPSDFDCTVVCTPGLSLPQQNKGQERWTSRERISIAMFFAVAAMGLGYFTSLPQSVLKVLGLDESWVLRTFSQGRDLINRALRLSRSLNMIPLMLMQNATDYESFGESITGMFSWRFLLRQMNALQEVKASLRIAGLPDSDEEAKEWEEVFGSFESGQGLVVDAEGHVNLMTVRVIPERLNELFSTTPKGEEQRSW